MIYRVVVLMRADADIENNARWWADNHSVEQAIRWVDAVRIQLETLSQFPTRFGLSAENDGFPYEIREQLVGLGANPSYRAIFTIRDEEVYVLAVRRASQRALAPSDIDFPPGVQ